MTEAHWDIIVAGHICLDITPRFGSTAAKSFGELLVPGKLVNVGACVVSTGGPVSNTGLALVKLGARTLLMGKVGDDAFGRSVVEKMREFGAHEGIITVPGEQTSYTIVVAPPGVDRVFLHNPGANDTFRAADIPYERLERVRLFHFGYPPLMRGMYVDGGRELIEILRRARERGVTVSLDMSLPDPESESGAVDWKAVLAEALPYVDLFVPSAEEVLFALERKRFMELRAEARSKGVDTLHLLSPDDYSGLAGQLLSYGAAVALLKSGSRGIYLRSGSAERLAKIGRAGVADTANWAERELWEPPFAVDKVVSATGAGDSAIAGFLASFLRRETVEDALRYATAAGAQNVVVPDAVSGIQGFPETRKRIQKGWPKAALKLEGQGESGWRLDASRSVWVGPNDRGRASAPAR